MTVYNPLQSRAQAAVVLLVWFVALGTTACSRQGTSSGGLSPETTLVTVSTVAEVRRPPDIATLSTGVVSLAPDVRLGDVY
jgi:uncharacterized protein YggE